MRKPSFNQCEEFKQFFDEINKRYNLNQQLIPYFISSHPGCTECDMAELACKTKKLNFHLEQVQDFTPTPMTMSTEMYYTGYNPYTLNPIYTAHSKEDKLAQRKFFFWYEKEYKQEIIRSLQRMKRTDLINELYPGGTGRTFIANKPSPRRNNTTNNKWTTDKKKQNRK